MITREMTIEDIFTSFPSKAGKLASVMTDAGLHCVGCSASTWETVETGMYGHGMKEEEIDTLLNKLNAILEEKEDLSTVTLTPKAAKKFSEILEQQGKQGWGLRLGEKAAGCSGFEFSLEFSEKPEEKDRVFHSEGIEIHLDQNSLKRLLGSVIDYVEGLNGSGFKVTNPNVRSACGCGNSHGY